MRDSVYSCNRFLAIFVKSPRLPANGSKMRLAAPAIIGGYREAAFRHLGERVVHPACKKDRRRIPAALTLLRPGSLLTKPIPPFAIPAVRVSVFHFFFRHASYLFSSSTMISITKAHCYDYRTIVGQNARG
jgi:hypothetical protein